MRQRLPNRRLAVGLEFVHVAPDGSARPYTATLGYFPDGRLSEVFLNSGKTGSEVDISTRDSAIVLSLALQHDCPLADMAPAFLRRPDGSPDGPLGSLVDAIVRQGLDRVEMEGVAP